MLRRTWTALGRRTEFLEKLDLLQKGMETKEIKKKYWLKVYTEDCTMDASGNMIEGLENIIAPFPAFNAAFDVKPKILEVIGDEDAERFAVRYRHEARFTGNYGIVAATGQTASFEGINLHTVNEAGLTTHLVQSTDLLSYFIQVGALPSLFEPEEEQPDLEGCGTVSMGTKAL